MRVGLVCTLRLPSDAPGKVVDSFLRYHLGKGFSHVWLFFDDPEDRSLPQALRFPSSSVTAIAWTDKEKEQMWKDKCPETLARLGGLDITRAQVTARQMLNAELALQDALGCEDQSIATSERQNRRVDYLLHIDIDELFYTSKKNVVPHFEALERRGIDHMTYANHEGIPEACNVKDYFKEVTLFRVNHLTLPLSSGVKEGMNFFAKRTNHHQYMLFYDNGKSAVRVVRNTHPASVHSWSLPPKVNTGPSKRRPRKGVSFADPRSLDLKNLVALSDLDGTSHTDRIEEPCILHYPCCGYFWLRSKYQILGDFPPEWISPGSENTETTENELGSSSNLCPGEKSRRIKIQPSLHLDARAAYIHDQKQETGGNTNKGLSLRSLFDDQILLSDQLRIKALIKAGVCRRVTSVQQSLRNDLCLSGCFDVKFVKDTQKVELKDDMPTYTQKSSRSTPSFVQKTAADPGQDARLDYGMTREQTETSEQEIKENGEMLDKSWLLAQISKNYL